MEDIIQQLSAILLPAIITAVGLMITLGLAKLKAYVHTQTQNATVDFALARLCDIIHTTVDEINQNVKEASDDGKLTAEEARRIKMIAVNKVVGQIPPDLEAVLQRATGDLMEWIKSKIEQAVYRAKTEVA